MLHVAYLINYYVTAEGLGEMLKDDFADMYAKKYPLLSMGGPSGVSSVRRLRSSGCRRSSGTNRMKSCYNFHNEHHFIKTLRTFKTCKPWSMTNKYDNHLSRCLSTSHSANNDDIQTLVLTQKVQPTENHFVKKDGMMPLNTNMKKTSILAIQVCGKFC